MKTKEIKKRVYYGDIDLRLPNEILREVAYDKILEYFGQVAKHYIDVEEFEDEFGAHGLEGRLTVILPSTYKEKDWTF